MIYRSANVAVVTSITISQCYSNLQILMHIYYIYLLSCLEIYHLQKKIPFLTLNNYYFLRQIIITLRFLLLFLVLVSSKFRFRSHVFAKPSPSPSATISDCCLHHSMSHTVHAPLSREPTPVKIGLVYGDF